LKAGGGVCEAPTILARITRKGEGKAGFCSSFGYEGGEGAERYDNEGEYDQKRSDQDQIRPPLSCRNRLVRKGSVCKRHLIHCIMFVHCSWYGRGLPVTCLQYYPMLVFRNP